MKDEKYQRRIEELERRLAAMENSLSWRITLPLRRVANWLGALVDRAVSVTERQAKPPDSDEVYAEWVRRYDTLTPDDRGEVVRQVQTMSFKPLISFVLLPTGTSDEMLLTIRSLQDQLYPHWELLVTGTTPEYLSLLIRDHDERDHRITVCPKENRAWAGLSHGTYLGFLDPGDQLPPHALYLVARELCNHPDTVLVYSDEDQINDDGRRITPHFKTDWNFDLFLSRNYCGRLTLYRMDAIRNEVTDPVVSGQAAECALTLYSVTGAESTSIRHMPFVLCHRRGGAQDPIAPPSHLDVISDYFKIHDPRVTVTSGRDGTVVVTYPLPDPPPLVSLIIPTRDGYKFLKRCVESIIKKTDYPRYELIIVDNQSTERQTCAYLQRLERDGLARVIRYDAPFNYSAINNFAVRETNGEVIGLLNNDLEVISRSWLTAMVRHVCRPEIGAIGAKLYYPNGRIQHGGVIMADQGRAFHAHRCTDGVSSGYYGRLVSTHAVSAVTAACLLVRRELYEAVGGLDEQHLRIAYNDVDFCLKLRAAGYRNLWTPEAELYHYESVSRGEDNTPEKQERVNRESEFILKKWGNQVAVDPAYNPNLSLEATDFSLAFPPRVERPWRSE